MPSTEAINCYDEALKKGKKEYKTAVGRGEYPFLPALDSILPAEKLSMGSDAGLWQLPAELIVGTLNGSRATAFSRGFLPLLPAQSEFGTKWRALCDAQLEEGIRDPILAYEYLNRYYVQEGNKRVSVLKALDAVEISAKVIRILPERDGSPEAERYFEFLRFAALSRILQVELSEKDGYASLQRLMGLGENEPWPAQLRSSFLALYEKFLGCFRSQDGKPLPCAPGDALLKLLTLCGFEALEAMPADTLKQLTAASWPSFLPETAEQPAVALELDPEDAKDRKEKKPGVLGKMLGKAAPKRVAFLYDRSLESKWVQGHESGRLQVQEALGDRIATAAYFRGPEETAEALLQKAADDGSTVIFTTSPVMIPAAMKTAAAHPELLILNCSLNIASSAIRSYYARMYEIKFISGAIAGCICGTKDVGYIGDYPIYGQIAGINAFAAGVNLVNPTARVLLEWSCTHPLEQAEENLRAQGIALISSLDAARLASDQGPFGLYYAGKDGTRTTLAQTVWQWGTYYELILRRILDGSLKASHTGSERALNYYWGLRSGVVSVELSPLLPEGTRKLAELLRAGIANGTCEPFALPLYRQGGEALTENERRSLSMEEIVRMDWLAENIIGSLPAFEELNETGKKMARLVGVPSVRTAGGAL